ncbi:oligosaccharide flippase family protein [Paraglaciecola aquimarina]|uniref:Oligosaccharide flippase family protein n=1 Tax=Paraglaciecola algarum TaxID=3050085 RepID=A0ABS9DAG5_9ALTE|nr:oligosaccharide flippase family protein [Paraglaciecola sp. G1-23]MCF2949888.1 oligosaccharide flippase family protein [Paraglaciecola sp. G1-23]
MKSILLKLGKLMSVRMLAIGLTFVQTIVMTRVFGSEVFGLLSIALSISALAVLLLSAGLDQVLMRDIARIGKSRVVFSNRWQDLWRLIIKRVLPITLAVTAVGGIVVTVTPFVGPYQLTLLATFLLLPVILCRKYLESICLGTKQVVRSITGSQIVYPVLMILAGFYVWYMGIKPDATSVSVTYAFAAVGSLIASILLITATVREIRAKTQTIDTHTPENADLLESPGEKALLKSGLHFSLVSLGFVLGQHIDVLMMGVLSTPENVALVRIAARVAEMAGLIRAIILLQYRPQIAEAYGKSDKKKLQQHAEIMVKLFTLSGIPITLGFWIFAEQVMMVFGPEFVAGAWAMRIYIAGVLVTLLFGPGNAMLAMTENEGSASRIVLSSLLIQVLFNIVLIPWAGPIGCACANFLAMCFIAIASRFMLVKKLGVEPSILVLFPFHKT